MTALRQVIASFGIEFDKEGNLDKGDKKIDGMTEQLLGMGKALLGAFAIKEVVAWGKEVLADADALAKHANALGVSAGQLQGWEHAASLSGSSAEEFDNALTKFTRNVAEAGDAAGGPAAKAFKDLGVSIKDSAGNLGAPIELLDGVVAGLEGIQDPAKRTALVMDLFGKSGAKLLPLFSEGKEGIAKLRAEVQELGFGFDDAFLENAQEVNDNLDRLKLGLRGVGIQVLSEVLPGITEFSKKAVALAKTFIQWVRGTKAIQAGLAVLAGNGVAMMIAKVGGLGKALVGLGRLVMRTVFPFLALEDAMVFLAGGKSLIGRGLDKMFGAGAGEEARAAILKWFNDVKTVVVNDVLPALKNIVESPLFQGAAKGALDGILAVLSAIGVALTDNTKRAEALVGVLKRSAAGLGLGPSEPESAGALEAGLPENRKELTGPESFTRKFVTTIFGDPLDDPAVRANEQHNRDVTERKRADAEALAKQSPFFAPTAPAAPNDYASYFRPTVATLPAAASPITNNNIQSTVAPVTTVNVTVQGDGAETGNRVGKTVAKIVAPINMRAIKDGLVPTPG